MAKDIRCGVDMEQYITGMLTVLGKRDNFIFEIEKRPTGYRGRLFFRHHLPGPELLKTWSFSSLGIEASFREGRSYFDGLSNWSASIRRDIGE